MTRSYARASLAAVALLALAGPSSPCRGADLLDRIEILQLANGIPLYLAPAESADTVNIEIRVNVGTTAETDAEVGAAHLLEHSLFRAEELQSDMTYLQVISQEGGKANASTGSDSTTFWAIVPAEKGSWLIELMARMLLERQLTDDQVEMEKATVALEIGEIHPLVAFLGFDPGLIFHPPYLEVPGFWERELGMPAEPRPSQNQIRLRTAKLRRHHVQGLYDRYYHAGNLVIFVAGRFDRDSIHSSFARAFGAWRGTGSAILPPDPLPTLNRRPYRSITPAGERCRIQVGTRFIDLTPRAEVALRAYLDQAAFELMKVLRNERGETYTVSPIVSLRHNFGWAGLSLAAPPHAFQRNLELVRAKVREEATAGGVTEEQFDFARQRYLQKHDLDEPDVSTMMAFAYQAYSSIRRYGSMVSPYKLIQQMDVKTYRDELRRLFDPEAAVEDLDVPPLLFRGDVVVMAMLVIILCSRVFRLVFRRRFRHDEVRWIRKLAYPPLRMLEIGVAFAGFLLSIHVFFLLRYALIWLDFQDWSIGAWYFSGLLETAVAFCLYAAMFVFVPRKLMVIGDDLVVKCISYWSYRIPLASITKVSTVRILSWPFPLRLWLGRVRHRVVSTRLAFWQPVLLVETDRGKSYAWSVTRPRDAAAELIGLLRPQPPGDAGSAGGAEPVETPRQTGAVENRTDSGP
ncbi:MAG: insulinase family protein [Candidatus Schekmanbacteria bacterium]|nr:insulinase family protein [Candidatus Schekmanbacteria bacterium]